MKLPCQTKLQMMDKYVYKILLLRHPNIFIPDSHTYPIPKPIIRYFALFYLLK